MLLLYQILQNTPTQSRKNKILDQKFSTIVLHINVRTDEILSNISVAVLHGIAEDYFKINNYNWNW
jgi:hypothetical protein